MAFVGQEYIPFVMLVGIAYWYLLMKAGMLVPTILLVFLACIVGAITLPMISWAFYMVLVVLVAVGLYKLLSP